MVCHDMYMMWKPRTMSEITPESLVFLELIKPSPQVLVLGCGPEVTPIPPAVKEYLAK
jgi:NADH dehydrogenase [ubiquinone] 1 alpha subcomplex assembly factor 3